MMLDYYDEFLRPFKATADWIVERAQTTKKGKDMISNDLKYWPERRKKERRKSTGRRFADVPGRRVIRRRKNDRDGKYRRST